MFQHRLCPRYPSVVLRFRPPLGREERGRKEESTERSGKRRKDQDSGIKTPSDFPKKNGVKIHVLRLILHNKPTIRTP